jgi:hypothetical protein
VEIMPWKYAKLLSNLANAIGAILGPDADEADLPERAQAEALRCYEAAGIAYVEQTEVQRRTSEVSAPRAVKGHEHSGSSSARPAAQDGHDRERLPQRRDRAARPPALSSHAGQRCAHMGRPPDGPRKAAAWRAGLGGYR